MGVLPSHQAESNHRVLVYPDQPAGLANAATVCQMLQDSDGLVLGQARIKERCPFAFGESGRTGATTKQAALVGPVTPRHGQIAVTAFAVVDAVRVLTAEATQIVHGGPPWPGLSPFLGLPRNVASDYILPSLAAMLIGHHQSMENLIYSMLASH